MPTLWRRLRALPAADRRLLVEAALLMLRARAGLRLMSFTALRRRLDAAAVRRASPQTPEKVSWAVATLARRLPGTTCLVQSLAAHALLSRRGYAPELHIGVRGLEGGAGVPLDAHAWVECDGRVVAGDVAGLAEYDRLRPAPPRASPASGPP